MASARETHQRVAVGTAALHGRPPITRIAVNLEDLAHLPLQEHRAPVVGGEGKSRATTTCSPFWSGGSQSTKNSKALASSCVPVKCAEEHSGPAILRVKKGLEHAKSSPNVVEAGKCRGPKSATPLMHRTLTLTTPVPSSQPAVAAPGAGLP
eukprot:CAMPEP_0170423324 /NCGR_PEP_ID=MMETSP0117_2-20130122/36941_1 /TAXON_ID=400756 /ORGANISM="Durinskia baltica, Strain CSIRO CS-38" /LENGTH=151 /DNA_ID=CAMNT_0010682073 /DNA_START=78 /DNA_END=532 /DNA_ORIENTATION=-